jgi:hypothetical protein
MVLYLSVGDWLKSPPGWLIAILLALLVAHLLKLILEVIDRTRDHTINAIEIVVTLGLLALAIHQAYENSVKQLQHVEWFEHPLIFFAALIFFAFLSGILVLIHKLFSFKFR